MGFFKRGELALLWPFYLKELVFNLFYFYPVFYIPFLNLQGFSIFQMGIIMSVSAIAGIIFEIPTGAIADLYGRKLSTILGFLFSGISLFLVFFFHDFYSVVILFFLFGFFITFISGASDAWVIDLLKHHKKENLIHEFYTKGVSFSSFSLFFTGILGAFFVKSFGISIIWPFTGMSMIVTAVVLMFGKEYFVKRKQHIKQHFREFVKHNQNSLRYSYHHLVIFNLLLMGIFMSILSAFAGDMTWYPLLQNLGLKEYWFGYLFSAIFFLGMVLPYLIKSIVKKTGSYLDSLIWISGAMSTLLFITYFIKGLVAVLIFTIIFFSGWLIFSPPKNILFQKVIPSKMRATITSVNSLGCNLATAIALPIVGFMADHIGIQKTISLGGFFGLVAVLVLLRIRKEESIK